MNCSSNVATAGSRRDESPTSAFRRVVASAQRRQTFSRAGSTVGHLRLLVDQGPASAMFATVKPLARFRQGQNARGQVGGADQASPQWRNTATRSMFDQQ